MSRRTGVPTLEDVARAAGVSRATASRVVNADERVQDATREAVLAAIRDLGYSPNLAARSLVTRRTDTIAVVVPESDERVFNDPFFAGTLRGVTKALALTELQMVLLIGSPGDGDGRLDRYIRGRHTDGAIIVSHHANDNLWRSVAEVSLPTVFLGRPFAEHPGLTFVDVDNVAAAALATGYLVDSGRTRIGTVAGPADMSAGADRLEGWRSVLTEHGLPADAVELGDFTVAGGGDAMTRLLAGHPDLDAVFVASDLMASGAMDAIRASGRAIPTDIAVVGMDNLELATRTRPPLTTVVNPVDEMATQAVAMLLAQLEGGPILEPVTMPTELVVRESA
ncbi:LacI family DNA-binding transcriptional regulator [Occultella kanbiaonis]|uniref:LacI family DNA-binding transcriptional regulator n=1 Tax=Occultella kanbiaonis TaxID=2675754 RepID=UPI0012B8D265|nr:LacI family DNA-binding transcriptional regulator [Occultella kanbiaonis]